MVDVPLELTTDPGAFIGKLKAGDVLLFDSLHPLSGLIQLAENRPVSHAGLYLGQGKFAQVSRESEQHPAAARIESLDDRLKLPHDRTATALRHIDIINGATADGVVTWAHDYVDTGDTVYAYLSLITLMVPALFRTYELYFDEAGGPSQLIGTVLEALSQSVLAVFEPEMAYQTSRTSRKSLTCSEFVYRCFFEADPPLPIALTDPLFAYNPVPPSHSTAFDDRGAGADVAGQEPGEGAVVLTMHRSMANALTDGEGGHDGASGGDDPPASGFAEWDPELFAFLASDRGGDRATGDDRNRLPVGSILVESSSSSTLDVSGLVEIDGDRALGGAATRKQLAIAGMRIIRNLVAHNVGMAKYGVFRPGRVDAAAVLPDTVTPKDLWSSDSLVAVAILHRPPEEDARLDEVQHH